VVMHSISGWVRPVSSLTRPSFDKATSWDQLRRQGLLESAHRSKSGSLISGEKLPLGNGGTISEISGGTITAFCWRLQLHLECAAFMPARKPCCAGQADGKLLDLRWDHWPYLPSSTTNKSRDPRKRIAQSLSQFHGLLQASWLAWTSPSGGKLGASIGAVAAKVKTRDIPSTAWESHQSKGNVVAMVIVARKCVCVCAAAL
jgi:hypothetical protein